MLVLDSTNRKIEVSMDSAGSTLESPVVATYDDIASNATSYTPATRTTITAGVSWVTSIPSPAANTLRVVKYLCCRNDDSATRICTFRFNDNGTAFRNLASASLQTGDAMIYVNGQWYVQSKLGLTAIPGGVVTGDLLYGSATGILSRLSIGTQGQFLQAGSTRPQWANLFNYTTKSANYTVAQTDSGFIIDVTTGSSADVTITLPAASGTLQGMVVWIRKTDSGTKGVIVAPAAADGINGNTVNVSTKLKSQYAIMGLICTGQTGINAWEVIYTAADHVTSGAVTVNLTSSGSFENITSISLEPGIWLIDAVLEITPGTYSAGSITPAGRIAISTVNSTSGGDIGPGDDELDGNSPTSTSLIPTVFAIGGLKKVITSTKTVYLNCLTLITGKTGSFQGIGRISALRVG